MEKSSLFKNMRLVATQQILLPIISMKMSLIISERKTDLLIPLTSVYLIIQFRWHNFGGTRRPWSHCTSNLTTPIHDSTNISIVMNMLFIIRKLNMIK